MKISNYPVDGKFGKYGGRFVPEILMEAINELEKAYDQARNDPQFQKQLDYYLVEFVGRPTPLYYAENLSRRLGGAKIYLKREDLYTVEHIKLTTQLVKRCLLNVWVKPA